MEGLIQAMRGATVKVCPKCGSPEVSEGSWLEGWLLPAKYICRRCGYSGHLIVELEAGGQGA